MGKETYYLFPVYNFFDIFAGSQHKGIYQKQKATKRYVYAFKSMFFFIWPFLIICFKVA